MTNEKVIKKLWDEHQIKFVKFSEMWKKQKLRLFGHIVRSNDSDPLKQVVFEPNSYLLPRFEWKRRRGAFGRGG